MARILLIEDDEDVRELIGQMLEEAGYSVSSAVDGEDGIVQFLHQPADLVLCDVFMPKKSGIAVLKELRRLGWGVPVIVMSGGTPSHIQTDVPEADLRGLAKLLGANATLAKPFRAPELISIIKQHLPRA